jgi:hypothetical protein
MIYVLCLPCYIYIYNKVNKTHNYNILAHFKYLFIQHFNFIQGLEDNSVHQSSLDRQIYFFSCNRKIYIYIYMDQISA